MTLTPDQEDILLGLTRPPRKVLVPSGHDVGKTFVAAVAVSWWFDAFDPGIVITTAPTLRDVVDLLWAEIRILRQRAGLFSPFTGPRAPEMFHHEHHYAKGFTARRGETFKGRHRSRMLFIFDEGNEVDPPYYVTTRTMFDAAEGHAWLVIFNPTDTSSAAYLEDLSIDENPDNPPWYRRRLSALNHPNIKAELAGERKPIKGAVSLSMIRDWIRDWCEPVAAGESPRATDVLWPPPPATEGRWYRPGPIFQSRAMGLWPDTGVGLWSDALWAACCEQRDPLWDLTLLPEIGCDTATGKAEDFHSIHMRWSIDSLHHETGNTMDPASIFVRLKVVAQMASDAVNRARPPQARQVTPQEILIKIDDDGVGRAIASFLWRDGYSAVPVGAATLPIHAGRYPNKRSELWFEVADRAKVGGVRLGRLPREHLRRLRQQLLTVTWQLNSRGQREVEPKADMKDRLGRSPDDADAMNLAYLEGVTFERPNQAPNPDRRNLDPQRQSRGRERLGNYGR